MTFKTLFLILRGRLGLIMLIFSLTVGATLGASLLLPAKFKAAADVVVDTSTPDPVAGTQMPGMLSPNYVATQTDIIHSHNVALRVVDKLDLRNKASAETIREWRKKTDGRGDIGDWLADGLLNNLDVQPGRDSNVIAITYQATNAQFAADVANTFAQEYIQVKLELMVQPARQSSQFFDTQLKGLRDQVEQAQARLSEYQREQGITSSDDRLDVEQTRLEGLSNQLIGVQGQAYDSQARVTQAGTASEVNDNMPEVLSNLLIQQLKTLIAESESKLTKLSNNVGTEHPQYQSALKELNDLKHRLAVETNRIVSGILSTAVAVQEREAATRAALEAQRGKLLSMKKKQYERAVLQRDVENAQHAYDFAMERAARTDMQSQLNQTNIAVFNPAVAPIEPDSPKLMRNLALSILLGAMLAIGAAIFSEILRRIVRSPEDIETELGVTVFGVLGRSIPLRHGRRQVIQTRSADPALSLAREIQQ